MSALLQHQVDLSTSRDVVANDIIGDVIKLVAVFLVAVVTTGSTVALVTWYRRRRLHETSNYYCYYNYYCYHTVLATVSNWPIA